MTGLPTTNWKPLYPGHEPTAADLNSMIARVASAIENCEGSYEDQARAAVEAMREPTEGMKEAVDCGGEKWNWPSGRMRASNWSTMIKAALEGK